MSPLVDSASHFSLHLLRRVDPLLRQQFSTDSHTEMSSTKFFSSERLIDTFSAGQRDVLERVAGGAPLREILECIVLLVERQSEGMYCSIVLLDAESKRLRQGAAPSLPEDYNRLIDGLEIGPFIGSCGAAAFLGERVIVEDIDTHPNWAPVKAVALDRGLRACWSTPIFSPGKKVLGTFAMYYRVARGPSPQEIGWVDAATHLAAIALCREAADRALQQSEARYRLMVDTAYEGVWLIDAQGRTTFANQRMGEMLGCTPEQMLGMSMFDFMDDAGRAEANINFARRKEGVSEQHEFRFRRLDGTDIWTIVAASPAMDEDGTMTAALGMVTDITKRKVAEAALARSEAEFRAVFEGSAIGMALVDADGRVQRSNPALEQLLGYGSREMEDLTLGHLTHPEDIDLSLFRSLVNGERDSYRYEKRYLHKSGSIVWARITASAVREPTGALRFVIGMVEDITQRHKAEEEQARLESQLRQSQKMQSLGTLAGGIAHDFNNILTAISGNTQLAIADLPPGHPALTSLAEVEQAAERAADLVRQILAFSRPQESNRKVLKLTTVVQEALRLLRASIPSTVAIRTAFDIATPEISGHATQIHQVIMNLGANGAHAIGDCAGVLEVQLAPLVVDAAHARTSPALREGLHACLTVKDSGRGMDTATLERIFEPFFTTKNHGQGTGLGLAVVHGIVHGHAGAISVESEPGHGTTFRLLFPAVTDAIGEVAAESGTHAPATRIAGHGERVLYVDDEERLVFLARRGLERLGYVFCGFTDPTEALRVFRERPAEFDLIITDLAMPGLSGLELSAAVLRTRPGIPILITSGYLRQRDQEVAEAMGLRDFIAKPATIDVLTQSIKAALSRGDTASRL